MKSRLPVLAVSLLLLGLSAPSAQADPGPGFLRRTAGRVARGAFRQSRAVAGAGTLVVTELHPVVRVADAMGVVDRRQIVRAVRGY